MSDKPDVAALTDEQCDAIAGRVLADVVEPTSNITINRVLIRAGRASLQDQRAGSDSSVGALCGEHTARPPVADVAALIARAKQIPHAPMCPGRFPDVAYNCQCQHRYATESAAALQSQAEEIRDLKETRRLLAERNTALFEEINAAEAERDALRKDAERYQHIRPMFRAFGLDMGGRHSWCPTGDIGRMRGPTLDAAIDAAIAARKP